MPKLLRYVTHEVQLLFMIKASCSW